MSYFKTISGTVNLPASKSLSNRLLALHFMASSEGADIVNISEAEDTELMQKAVKNTEAKIDLGNAGTAFRFLTACFAAKGAEKILTGSERMCQRPIAPLVEALHALGAEIQYLNKKEFPPLKIKKGIKKGGTVKIKAGMSSQYTSALLLIAPFVPNGLELELEGEQVSKPYVELTLRLLSYHGVSFERSENRIVVPEQAVNLKPMIVENDWSAASYFYALAALAENAEILLPGLHPQSWQGDSILVGWMENFGIETKYQNGKCFILKNPFRPLSFFKKDLTDYPDLAQTLAVLFSLLKIPFEFSGLKNLRIKECDRLEALKTELQKVGTIVEAEEGNVRSVSFNAVPQQPVMINTYNDHRMAMSFAPYSLIFPNIKIEKPKVVKKSFPAFWQEIASLEVEQA